MTTSEEELHDLVERGIVEEVVGADGKRGYQLTALGVQLAEAMEKQPQKKRPYHAPRIFDLGHRP